MSLTWTIAMSTSVFWLVVALTAVALGLFLRWLWRVAAVVLEGRDV